MEVRGQPWWEEYCSSAISIKDMYFRNFTKEHSGGGHSTCSSMQEDEMPSLGIGTKFYDRYYQIKGSILVLADEEEWSFAFFLGYFPAHVSMV